MRVIANDKFIKNATVELNFFDGQTANFDIKTVSFDDVLLTSLSGKVNIGKPIVKNSSVIGEIKSQFKGPKVKGIRYKNKTRHSVRTGHRQQLTSVEIMDLSKSPAKAKTGSKSKKEDKDGT